MRGVKPNVEMIDVDRLHLGDLAFADGVISRAAIYAKSQNPSAHGLCVFCFAAFDRDIGGIGHDYAIASRKSHGNEGCDK